MSGLIDLVTYASLTVLTVVSIVLHFVTQGTAAKKASLTNPQFVSFKYRYYVVYFLALFADWLQGPYVYKLYSYYGFAESQIAVLYVVGFGASVLFGTCTGAFADRVGRMKMSIVFCILYSICCLTKLSPNFWILCAGRVMGGISTSLLFSTFESWYVYEHTERHDFPSEWISVTFSEATFFNGVLAIVAGVLSNVAAEWLNFGPVSPFMMAIPCLLASCFVIYSTWDENYGSPQKFSRSCTEALKHILFDEKTLLLGLIQSSFESVMYMFVFLWTPVLDSLRPQIGLIFSCFMLCIMIGSCFYQLLSSYRVPPKRLLLTAVVLSFVSMITCVFATSPNRPRPYLAYCSFLLLEIGVGIYFPAVGYLRSRIVPEAHRASIMNWFRVPMNVLTCVGLMFLHSDDSRHGNQSIFLICSFLIGCGILLSIRLDGRLESADVSSAASDNPA